MSIILILTALIAAFALNITATEAIIEEAREASK